jgi:predicted deacylase
MNGRRFEIGPPDLARWRGGNAAVPGVWRFTSGQAGREVMVTALVHGNELCGAWALAAALEAGVRPRRGALTLAFCNLEAFDRFDPAQPDAARFVEQDMNRLWGEASWRRSSGALSCEQRRVLELAPIVERSEWLLDLHSMHEPGPPLGLVGPLPHHAAQAMQLGAPELLVTDAGHQAGRRMRDHGAFFDRTATERFALLVECGFHGDPHSRTVALDVLARFLAASGCVDADDLPAAWRQPAVRPQQLLEVTDAITVASGEPPRLVRAWSNGEVIQHAGTVIGWTGGQPIRTPYDRCILVMPTLIHASPGGTLVRLARERTVV